MVWHNKYGSHGVQFATYQLLVHNLRATTVEYLLDFQTQYRFFFKFNIPLAECQGHDLDR